MGKSQLNIAIVGVTTPKGKALLQLLEKTKLPLGVIRPLTTGSVGKRVLSFRRADYAVDVVSPQAFRGMDIVFFADQPQVTLDFAEGALRAGCVCLDASGAYALALPVPLVVPEVTGVETGEGLVASPDPAVVFISLVLQPLQARMGVEQVEATLLHGVGEEGEEAQKELRLQTKDFLGGARPAEGMLPYTYAFNVVPLAGAAGDHGYAKRERDIARQLQRVFRTRSLEVNVTSLRVPLLSGLCGVLTVRGKKGLSRQGCHEALAAAEGIFLYDDLEKMQFPTALSTIGTDKVWVGRVRCDEEGSRVSLFFAGDDLYRGYVVNVMQMAERIATTKILGP